MKKNVEKILQYVQKPARYAGGELNSVIKNKSQIDLRYAFCFPDIYEIGMSHLGMKILYSLVNSREDSWCERVFAPDTDMEEQMRKNNVPLFALESGDYIKEFDVVGFTLMYELSYTNMLNMLELAGIPLLAEDRKDLAPIICLAAVRAPAIPSRLLILLILFSSATAKNPPCRFWICLKNARKTANQSTNF